MRAARLAAVMNEIKGPPAPLRVVRFAGARSAAVFVRSGTSSMVRPVLEAPP